MSPRPTAAQRLDRDAVLASALAISDAEGLDALTLRRVATQWNVTPMALYWHFKDKDALLDAVVGRVLSEVDVTEHDDLPSVLAAMLRALRAHPALAEITPFRIMRTDAGLELAERVIALLRAAGHSPAAAAQLSIFMLDAAVGLVTRQPGDLAVADGALREQLIAEKRGRLKSLSPQEFPHLTETADFFLGLPDEDDYYERGVRLILNALQID